MKMIFATMASLLFLTGCVSQLTEQEEEACLQKGTLWLSYLDEGKVDQLWEDLSVYTKKRTSKEDYLKNILGLRDPFGKLIKRRLDASWEMGTGFFVLPDDGVYRQLKYSGKYEQKNFTIETLYMSLENGEWKVVQWRL